jgi:hypothetical protein
MSLHSMPSGEAMDVETRGLSSLECLARANECYALSAIMVEHTVALRLLGDLWKRIAEDVSVQGPQQGVSGPPTLS